jgi:threonine dehydrogenase-like Zn-dependent dehydrogenase
MAQEHSKAETINFDKDYCWRKGGTLSIPGVYIGAPDKIAFGADEQGLTIRTGQTHMQRYMTPLLAKIEKREIDPLLRSLEPRAA